MLSADKFSREILITAINSNSIDSPKLIAGLGDLYKREPDQARAIALCIAASDNGNARLMLADSNSLAAFDDVREIARAAHPYHRNDFDKGMRRNAEISGAMLDALADYHNTINDHTYFVASHKKTLPETLARLANISDVEVRMNVGGNVNTPADTLQELAQDIDKRVRAAVARNTSTSVNTLVELSKNDSIFIVSSVAKNPNTPVELLERFASRTGNDDNDRQMRLALVENPSIPAQLLEKIIQEETSGDKKLFSLQDTYTYWNFLGASASNPQASTPSLEKIFSKAHGYNPWQDKEKIRRESVFSDIVRNKNAPAIALTHMSHSRDPNIRMIVVQHENTPRNVVLDMLRDFNTDIKSAAAQRLVTPTQREALAGELSRLGLNF